MQVHVGANDPSEIILPQCTVQHEGGKMQEEAKERKEEERPPTCCQHFTPNFRQENNKPKTPPPDCMREEGREQQWGQNFSEVAIFFRSTFTGWFLY